MAWAPFHARCEPVAGALVRLSERGRNPFQGSGGHQTEQVKEPNRATTFRLPSQNANGVLTPVSKYRISRLTPFTDCELVSRSVPIASGFGGGYGISAKLLYGCAQLKTLGRSARQAIVLKREVLCTPQEAIMATNDERHAAHILTLLEQAPGRQLSSEELAAQTGWSPEELSAAVGLLRGRQQVVLDDAALGSGNYSFTSIMLP